jgi:perosamine synthetase
MTTLKPAFQLADAEARKDPTVQALCVRQEMWKYYPRLIYDINLSQLGLAWLWTAAESERNQEKLRLEVGKVFYPQMPKNVITTLSLRTFFDALLRTLKLPAGSEIVWSGVSIPQMFLISDYHKVTNRAFDIDLPTFEPDLAAAEACFTDKTKILVLAPVFGRPMRRLKELCAMAKKRGVISMIDGAQCFCIKDELLAIGADITSFSFGSIKYSTAINGSVSLVRDNALCERVRAAEKELPVRSLGKHVSTLAKTGLLLACDDPISFGVMRVGCEVAGVHIGEVTNAMSRGFPGAELIKQIRFRPRAANLRLLIRRVERYDNEAQRLRTISGWDFLSRMPPYVQIASGGDPDEPERSTFWLFPMNCRDPKVVSDILQAQGFDAALGTSQMRATGDATSTPQCHAFMSQVLYLPVYPEMNDDSRDRFIAVMNKIPRKYIESPSQRFHEYVASRKEKHAYRSAAIAKLVKNRPAFKDSFPSVVAIAGLPVLPLVLAKL